MNHNEKIIKLLTELKKDVHELKSDMKEVREYSGRIDKLESIVDRAKGMAIIVVSVATVIFTLMYDYVKKALGL